eukprot:172399-Amphidinium_carterae.1
MTKSERRRQIAHLVDQMFLVHRLLGRGCQIGKIVHFELLACKIWLQSQISVLSKKRTRNQPCAVPIGARAPQVAKHCTLKLWETNICSSRSGMALGRRINACRLRGCLIEGSFRQSNKMCHWGCLSWALCQCMVLSWLDENVDGLITRHPNLLTILQVMPIADSEEQVSDHTDNDNHFWPPPPSP